ncbi:MAG: hypothetical protein E7399_07510 [Ruminococcaceae bacterium]|nr:hypothetical protein [Oscillospiraceae bacterium]
MSLTEAMQERISNMTLEQKLGMLICARAYIFHDEDLDFIIELIKKRALGAIQLRANRPDLNERILKEVDYPLIVVADMEQGYPETELPLIPLISLAACNKKEYYQAFAKGIVRDAKKAGFNANWGPVVDLLHEDAPCKVSRVLSDDPEKVAWAAEEIARIFRQNHFLSTGKHFPGGKEGIDGIPVDSHLVESASTSTEQELLESDFLPYKHLMNKGLLPCIMTTHSVFQNIDPEYPVTLSKKVVDIIRNAGYEGIIFTDSLSMSGIKQKYSEETLHGQCIAAGHDILLPCFNTLTKDVHRLLKKNYEEGIITEERLNDAVAHVLAAQDFLGQTPENPTVFTEQDEELLKNVARDCVTAVTDDGISPALDGNKKKLFVVMEEEKRMDEASGEINISPWYNSKQIGEKIKQEYPDAEVQYLPPLSIPSDHMRVLEAAKTHEEIVLVTYCYTTAYLGTDCLTRRSEAILNALIHTNKVAALLHFGNPHAVKNLFHVPRKIFGYIMPESQGYAIQVLNGKTEAKGTLPFKVDFR